MDMENYGFISSFCFFFYIKHTFVFEKLQKLYCGLQCKKSDFMEQQKEEEKINCFPEVLKFF